MTYPDGPGGPPPSGRQPHDAQPPYSPSPYQQSPYHQSPYPPSAYPHPQAPYSQPGNAQAAYPQQPNPQQHPYPQPDPWSGPGQTSVLGPPPGGRPGGGRPPGRGPSTGVIVALVVAGVVFLGLIGGGIALIANRDTAPTDQAAPLDPGSPTTLPESPLLDPPTGGAVTVAMPRVIDGHTQIDNRYAKQLVDGLRKQLESNPAGTGDAVVGIFGETTDPLPAFLVAATTTDQDPELILTGVAAGMQQSAGTTQLDFVDKPAGPLGGSMRCAESTQQFTACIWGTEGAFGINIVYGEGVTKAAATTVRVRQAVEIHS